MSNAAILYLRLLRRIVRESACRLGGAEETFLTGGFGGSYEPVVQSGGDGAATRLIARNRKPGVSRSTSCGQSGEQE